MEYAALIVLIVSLPPCQAVQMCAHTIHMKKYRPVGHIMNLKMPGIISCSCSCLNRHGCVSFNFNMATNECQLNSKTKSSASAQLSREGSFAFSDISHCKDPGCVGRPPGPKHGRLLERHMLEESPLGTVLPHTCDPGYMSKGEVVCLNNGQWFTTVCANVSSCSNVKQIRSNSVDGEYWLRLSKFDNYIARIYCHKMDTSSPQEYLTLPNTNTGVYPRRINPNCFIPTGHGQRCRGKCRKKQKSRILSCRGNGGKISFNKIKINIETMKVDKKDKKFARKSSSGKGMYYGCAQDCYAKQPNKNGCETKGRFHIDLRGTGWRVSADQQWKVTGSQAVIDSIDRNLNGTVINLRCGGFAGGCCPRGGLHLIPFP